MEFQYPSQRLQDWLSQRWVMARGRRVDPREIAWLFGPFGDVDVIADHYIERLASEERLAVERDAHGAGLLDSIEDLLGPDAARLDHRIRGFYERTSDHALEVWSQWSPLFRPFAVLINRLYSRRLHQLNLPLKPLDTSRGITSEVVKLREPATGRARYTVWFRRLRSTGQVVYSGIYAAGRLPSGERCAKIVFPLPRGNATVIMRPAVTAPGGLELISSGARFGDHGFYFLLRDKRRRHWAQYIRSFRERIHVYVDEDGVLRTDHTLSLWGRRALTLHYKITPLVALVAPAAGQVSPASLSPSAAPARTSP